MIRVGIIGAAGYTAGELTRLLVNHPDVTLSWLNSSSNAGNPVTGVHGGLHGDIDMAFTDTVDWDSVDVVFICSGHGASREFLAANPAPERVRVIDLSQDFRDESDGFVYGLPECDRAGRINGATRLANPGCFATAIQLALLPAAAGGHVKGAVEVTAVTGSTGAGVKPSTTTHFSYRSDNLSTYKTFNHQHLLEIGRNLAQVAGGEFPKVHFVPVRGDFARGIFASVYFPTDLTSTAEAVALYRDYYKDAPFTHVVEGSLDLKQVINTNKCLVSVQVHDGLLHVVSVIDNLLKGASGQAVQNMNLMMGLDPRAGLRLKASAF